MKSKLPGFTIVSLSFLFLGLFFSSINASGKVSSLQDLASINPAVNCEVHLGTDCLNPATGNIRPDERNIKPASEIPDLQ